MARGKEDLIKAYQWIIVQIKEYGLFIWLGFWLAIGDINIWEPTWWFIIIGCSIIYNVQVARLMDKEKPC